MLRIFIICVLFFSTAFLGLANNWELKGNELTQPGVHKMGQQAESGIHSSENTQTTALQHVSAPMSEILKRKDKSKKEPFPKKEDRTKFSKGHLWMMGLFGLLGMAIGMIVGVIAGALLGGLIAGQSPRRSWFGGRENAENPAMALGAGLGAVAGSFLGVFLAGKKTGVKGSVGTTLLGAFIGTIVMIVTAGVGILGPGFGATLGYYLGQRGKIKAQKKQARKDKKKASRTHENP